MARELTADMIAELAEDVIRPVLLIQFRFDDANVNFWSGYGTLQFNGEDWLGAGDLGIFSPITESGALNVEAVDFTLNGMNSSVVSAAMNQPYRGRRMLLYLGFFDDDDASFINEPVVMFAGYMDVMTIKRGAQASAITVRCESAHRIFREVGTRKWNHQSHTINFPADPCFTFINALQQQELIFGPSSSRDVAERNRVRLRKIGNNRQFRF